MEKRENLETIKYEKPELVQFDYNRTFIARGASGTSCDDYWNSPPSASADDCKYGSNIGDV